MQTFVMMVGELNYQNNFLDPYLKDELPFGYLTYLIFVKFTLLMPILLVNLMVSMIWQLVVSINSDSVKRILPVNTLKLLNLKCVFVAGCVVDWFSSWRHCWSSKKCCPKKNSYAGMSAENLSWWGNNQMSFKKHVLLITMWLFVNLTFRK